MIPVIDTTLVVLADSVGTAEVDTVVVEKSDTLPLYYLQHYVPVETTRLTYIGSTVNPGKAGTPLSYSLQSDDGITAILLFSFFLIIYTLAHGKRFLIEQAKEFFLNKERANLFVRAMAADIRYRLLLIFQTCVLIGVALLYFFHELEPTLLNGYLPIRILGIYIAVVMAYYALKSVVYRFVMWVFFDKTKGMLWLDAHSVVISYFGFLLFPLTLMMVYFHLSVAVVVPTAFFLIIITKLLLFYKCLNLFFSNMYGVLCLIAYFCALEIVSCFVLYGVLTHINHILQIKF